MKVITILLLVVIMTLTCLLDKTRGSVLDMRHVQVKRSPQEAAEGEEKPPVWCSFALPWRWKIFKISPVKYYLSRGVSGLVDRRCQEIAGVAKK